MILRKWSKGFKITKDFLQNNLHFTSKNSKIEHHSWLKVKRLVTQR